MRVVGVVAACTAAALAACTGRAPRPVAIVLLEQNKRLPCGKATSILAALALVLALGSSHAACNTSTPCVTAPIDLGTLGGILPASAGIINNQAAAVNGNGNVVVGSDLTTDNVAQAFLWRSGIMVDLGTLGGPASHALDVNDAGRIVVGVADTPDGGHTFRWTAGGDRSTLSPASVPSPAGGDTSTLSPPSGLSPAGGDASTLSPPSGPAQTVVEYDGKQMKTLRYNDLLITVDSQAEGLNRVAIATGNYRGHTVFDLRTDPTEHPLATVRVINLDRITSLPQVVLTYFTEGAHCCTVTRIATPDLAGNWHIIDAGSLDGHGYEFMDLDGDGANELVSVDAAFDNKFASCVSSRAPTRIQKLVGLELRDVTHEPVYGSFLRRQLQQLEMNQRFNGVPELNGYLGAWVAAKALVGEFDDAWRLMLASYERDSNWVMQECRAGLAPAECPDDQTRYMDFPEALLKLLLERHYITPVDVLVRLLGLRGGPGS
jgi:probable HAF family extracellular repeat protein